MARDKYSNSILRFSNDTITVYKIHLPHFIQMGKNASLQSFLVYQQRGQKYEKTGKN